MHLYQILLFLSLRPKGISDDLIPLQKNENIWVYLAKHVMNISDFYLKGGTYVEQTFASCLVGVCTPLSHVRIYTIFQYINKPISYSDIYNWGPITTKKDRSMFSLQVRTITPVDRCVLFTSFPNQCFNLSTCNSLNCSSATSVIYANTHVKLPAGWFLLCGRPPTLMFQLIAPGDPVPSAD